MSGKGTRKDDYIILECPLIERSIRLTSGKNPISVLHSRMVAVPRVSVYTLQTCSRTAQGLFYTH